MDVQNILTKQEHTEKKVEENENTHVQVYVNRTPLQLKGIEVSKVEKPSQKSQSKKSKAKKPIEKIQLRNLQCYAMDFEIQRPLREEFYFHLNGDYPLIINKPQDERFPYNKKINKLIDYFSFLTIEVPTQKCLSDYSLPIKMLEQQQSQDDYKLAQQLKAIQVVVFKTLNGIATVLASYQNHEMEFWSIYKNRKDQRMRMMINYINNYLNPDDFYLVCEVAGNFEHKQTNIISYSLSKPILSLIGLENDEANSFLLHQGIFGELFLSDGHKFNFAVNESFENIGQSKRHKDFTLKTIDQFILKTDVEMVYYTICYPEEAQFSRTNKIHYEDLDAIFIIKYDIQLNHLQSVLNYRYSHKNTLLFDYKINQSLEYSLLSQIIIEKYYPHKLEQLKICRTKPEFLLQCGFKLNENKNEQLYPPVSFFSQS